MNPINTYYKQGQLNSNVKEYLKKFTIYSEKLLYECCLKIFDKYFLQHSNKFFNVFSIQSFTCSCV